MNVKHKVVNQGILTVVKDKDKIFLVHNKIGRLIEIKYNCDLPKFEV